MLLSMERPANDTDGKVHLLKAHIICPPDMVSMPKPFQKSKRWPGHHHHITSRKTGGTFESKNMHIHNWTAFASSVHPSPVPSIFDPTE